MRELYAPALAAGAGGHVIVQWSIDHAREGVDGWRRAFGIDGLHAGDLIEDWVTEASSLDVRASEYEHDCFFGDYGLEAEYRCRRNVFALFRILIARKV